MKKAIKINISGLIFHIDEDAYEKLNAYIKSVELYFLDKAGGKEIIDDIEARIAELFQARTDNQKQVITTGHVDEIVGIMGDPSVFVEAAEEDPEEPNIAPGSEKRRSAPGPKRLYRDPDNAVFGGVCGGLGAYFGMDPVWFRILFVILLIAGYGVWGLVYIVLWIAVPKAITISQRLEMKGARVTVSNIQKSAREEFDGVKASFRNLEKTEGYKQASSAVEEIFQVLGRVLAAILKVVVILIGVVLIFAGVVSLMAFLGVFVFSSPLLPQWLNVEIFPLNRFFAAFIDPTNLTVMLVALFIAVIIPLISIIYGGIKLAFQVNSRDRGLGMTALVIWIVSISVLFSMGFVEGRKFAFQETYRENIILTAPEGRTLYLQLNERVSSSSIDEIAWFDQPSRGMYFEPGRDIYYSRPALNIRYARIDAPELVIERSARGSSSLQAQRNAGKISYNWRQEDSVLIFDNYLAIEPGNQWRFEEVTLQLNLPEDQQIHIGGRMDRIIGFARMAELKNKSELTGRKWRMTREGLMPALNQ
jgi:phage shock protein PspC (stress-responsive transcriptional regulator)